MAYLLFTTQFIQPDIPLSPRLLLRTSYCVAVILAIPYAIFSLIAANRSKAEEIAALKLSQTPGEPDAAADRVIHFYDYSGVLRLSLSVDNIYYIASQDNYVEIRYVHDGKLCNYLMRCHRSYIVNMENVAIFKREGARAFLVLSHPDAKKIPVSKSYYKAISEQLGRIAS